MSGLGLFLQYGNKDYLDKAFNGKEYEDWSKSDWSDLRTKADQIKQEFATRHNFGELAKQIEDVVEQEIGLERVGIVIRVGATGDWETKFLEPCHLLDSCDSNCRQMFQFDGSYAFSVPSDFVPPGRFDIAMAACRHIELGVFVDVAKKYDTDNTVMERDGYCYEGITIALSSMEDPKQIALVADAVVVTKATDAYLNYGVRKDINKKFCYYFGSLPYFSNLH